MHSRDRVVEGLLIYMKVLVIEHKTIIDILERKENNESNMLYIPKLTLPSSQNRLTIVEMATRKGI